MDIGNSAEQDQTPQIAASDYVLHFLFTLQDVKG